MSAIVRVKRRINEEPMNAFVLNCKKRKLDSSETRENLFETKDEVSTVLKFAGTVEYQDEPVTSQISRITKDEAKLLISKQRKPQNQTEKMRQEMRNNLHENRFKIVNCYRTLKESDIENGDQKEITVVDIEKEITITGTTQEDNKRKANDIDSETPSTSKNNKTDNAQNGNSTLNNAEGLEDNYVYDLYLPENDEQSANFDYIENYSNISIKPFDNLLYEDCYHDETDSFDSEDSNREDYYKNDYPDSDDEADYNSVDEEDMRKAVERCDIDGEYDLSSDDDEASYHNGFVYSVDSEAIGFEDDLDYCDVNRYGEAYARYKARVLKKEPENHDYSSEASDDNYESN